jgi:N4-gp56 family major capsid protein
MNEMMLREIDLSMFDLNTQVTTDAELSVEMKTYYSDYLIDNAKPFLVHDQFGQKKPIPKGKGKTIEFRKYTPFPKALKPLIEGVTPDGRSLEVTNVTATISQFGDYVTLSDLLMLTAIDNNLVQATELLGQQAGETLDTVTRDLINGGTNVQYADSSVLARHLLSGGEASGNTYLSVACTALAQRNMKYNKARTMGKDYVAIIHPDVTFDLRNDPKWEDWHKYASPEDLFNGEIGRLNNIRFVETTEAKIFTAANLTNAARDLGIASVAGKVFTVDEAVDAQEAAALVGRYVIVKGYLYTVASASAGAAGAATVTVNENVMGSPGASDIMYPGEAGAKGRSVYSTLVIGKDAYGTTDVEGGGLEFIVKQLGSGGTADPLNQRATTGWKATKTAKILTDAFILRIETASTFNSDAN